MIKPESCYSTYPMFSEIKEVYLSADYKKAELTTPETDSTDVIVQMENGDKHVASFFTYDYIKNWKLKEKDSKENLHGKFFWVPNMIIIDNCNKENIIKIIRHLIDEGDFKLVFRLLSAPGLTTKPND